MFMHESIWYVYVCVVLCCCLLIDGIMGSGLPTKWRSHYRDQLVRTDAGVPLFHILFSSAEKHFKVRFKRVRVRVSVRALTRIELSFSIICSWDTITDHTTDCSFPVSFRSFWVPAIFATMDPEFRADVCCGDGGEPVSGGHRIGVGHPIRHIHTDTSRPSTESNYMNAVMDLPHKKHR